MSIQRQLLYPNHKNFSHITLLLFVVLGSLLMGLVPLIYTGFNVIDASGNNLVIPAEAELWSPLSK